MTDCLDSLVELLLHGCSSRISDADTLRALDLGREHRLLAHVHGNEQVGIGKELGGSVETSDATIGLRQEHLSGYLGRA